jgi:hypothetical protein
MTHAVQAHVPRWLPNLPLNHDSLVTALDQRFSVAARGSALLGAPRPLISPCVSPDAESVHPALNRSSPSLLSPALSRERGMNSYRGGYVSCLILVSFQSVDQGFLALGTNTSELHGRRFVPVRIWTHSAGAVGRSSFLSSYGFVSVLARNANLAGLRMRIRDWS